jgi:hypothetical protein
LTQFINREKLLNFIRKLFQTFNGSGDVYLIGETTQLFEGWRAWVDEIEFTSEIPPEDKADFSESIKKCSFELNSKIVNESLADIIPLPQGFQDRMRQIKGINQLGLISETNKLKLFHYDPYSVAFRFIARGDEEDYQLVINYLKHGWLTVEKMDSLLSELLPHFSFETIQQDPAEFRRKYKGLQQIWENSKEESML